MACRTIYLVRYDMEVFAHERMEQQQAHSSKAHRALRATFIILLGLVAYKFFTTLRGDGDVSPTPP